MCQRAADTANWQTAIRLAGQNGSLQRGELAWSSKKRRPLLILDSSPQRQPSSTHAFAALGRFPTRPRIDECSGEADECGERCANDIDRHITEVVGIASFVLEPIAKG